MSCYDYDTIKSCWVGRKKVFFLLVGRWRHERKWLSDFEYCLHFFSAWAARLQRRTSLPLTTYLMTRLQRLSRSTMLKKCWKLRCLILGLIITQLFILIQVVSLKPNLIVRMFHVIQSSCFSQEKKKEKKKLWAIIRRTSATPRNCISCLYLSFSVFLSLLLILCLISLPRRFVYLYLSIHDIFIFLCRFSFNFHLLSPPIIYLTE